MCLSTKASIVADNTRWLLCLPFSNAAALTTVNSAASCNAVLSASGTASPKGQQIVSASRFSRDGFAGSCVLYHSFEAEPLVFEKQHNPLYIE